MPEAVRLLFFILLFSIPSLIFAQNMTGNQAFGEKGPVVYNPDPLTTYILNVDHSCNNHGNALKKEGKKAPLTETCQDYHKLVAETLSAESPIDNTEKSVNMKPYYIMAGTTTVIAVVVVVAL